ncbi:hypothetical protein B5M09_007224 [Aphanomyces astaci]|uniref:Helicase C-terminal domain-containing protein n=1 Tax=Aphanomyces astaci TaxID=112090 RepID=A0A425D2R8_APHAT|nr:hypothetical protein B5M09_007224 [Aphanomyces astaci]
MSATLRVEDFTENKTLFPSPPPVIKVEARQYPVTVHFNKHTEMNDYVQAAYQKVVKIHRKLPEGAILVFLTGQREILQLVRQLRRNLGSGKKKNKAPATNSRNRMQDEAWYIREHDDDDDQADLDDADVYGEETGDDSGDDSGDEEEGDEEGDEEGEDLFPYVHVLPLYSMLANDEQMKVFEAPPAKHRLVIVATNVAETSLTLPGVRYVVDAGRTKERVFDLKSGISQFEIQWISKASADQRAGRAGRTGPGHCYRLYSSAVYDNEFQKFSPPQYAIAVVASLTGQSPFILERERKEAESYRKEANDEDKLPSIDAESSEPQKNEMTQVDNAWTEELKEAEAMQRHAQWMDDDSDVLSTITSGTKIERNCAYMSCNGIVTEPLYIHPHSHLAYMKTVTAIEPDWLHAVAADSPLCDTSEPLDAPPPKYNAALDRVECYVKPTYGSYKWELPAVLVEYPAGPVKFRWFGRFLLDGLVVSALKPLLATKLREPSVSLIKKKFDAKIQLLVSALERSNVSSRRALVAQWQCNPQFLCEQVLNWVQDNHKAALKQHWNALVMRQVQAL